MKELKPCPFCGEEARIQRRDEEVQTRKITVGNGETTYIKGFSCKWSVICRGCRTVGYEYEDFIYRENDGRIVMARDGWANAIEAWNRRTVE